MLEIDRCVSESFFKTGDNTTNNYLLSTDKLLASVYGVAFNPSITINGQIYNGELTF